MSLLKVENARVAFRSGSRVVQALDDVSFELALGECLALVGESGCGKTTMARSVLGLQRLDSGTITLNGKAVKGMEPRQAERLGMIWQDPNASLDPRWTIERTLSEPYQLVGAKPEVSTLMEEIGLDPILATRYPHELSGGQRQRVAIGRAIALRPPLVICDEPTAALDLSVQAQILNLLSDMRARLGVSYLYISHDLLTVRAVADRVAVMQAGKIVEMNTTKELFANPQTEYTRTLLDAVPGKTLSWKSGA